MKNLNPEYIERVKPFVNHSPYFELLSMKILDVGIGFSLLRLRSRRGIRFDYRRGCFLGGIFRD
jgi:hypothetical protein